MKSQPSLVNAITAATSALNGSSIQGRKTAAREIATKILPIVGFGAGFLNSALNQNQTWGSQGQALGGVVIALLVSPLVHMQIASRSPKRSPSQALLATLLGIGLPYLGLLLSRRMDAYAALSGAGAGVITATAFTAAVGLRLALIPTLLASLSVVIAAGFLPTAREARDPLFLIVSTGFSGALGWLIHRAALWSADHQRLPRFVQDWLELLTGRSIATVLPSTVFRGDTLATIDELGEMTAPAPTVLEQWRHYIAAHPSKFQHRSLELMVATALELTMAETRVVQALSSSLVKGETSSLRKRLAAQLGVGGETIKSHLGEIYTKYNLGGFDKDHKLRLIVVIAAQRGLLELDNRISPDASPD